MHFLIWAIMGLVASGAGMGAVQVKTKSCQQNLEVFEREVYNTKLICEGKEGILYKSKFLQNNEFLTEAFLVSFNHQTCEKEILETFSSFLVMDIQCLDWVKSKPRVLCDEIREILSCFGEM